MGFETGNFASSSSSVIAAFFHVLKFVYTKAKKGETLDYLSAYELRCVGSARAAHRLTRVAERKEKVAK